MGIHSETALVLLSGGLDSSVAGWLAREEGWEIPVALTFDYGQRAAKRELESAAKIAEKLGADHLVLRLPFFGELFPNTGLLSHSDQLPNPKPEHLSDRGFSESSAKAVWVPNRNGIFLEVAAGIAEARGINALIVGFNREEAETFPDNSAEYLSAINQALKFSTQGRVSVMSPTAAFTKTELVAAAIKKDFPLPLVWSCYEAGDRMCGVCESCQRLQRALRENGMTLKELFS